MTIYDKIGNVTLYVLLSIAGWWFGTFFMGTVMVKQWFWDVLGYPICRVHSHAAF
jgi:hypothetical protein